MAAPLDKPSRLYLESCIDKRRSFEDIYEALELFIESGRVRIEPVFVNGSANELQKKIIAVAKSFRNAHAEDEGLKNILLDNCDFYEEVIKLGEEYGDTIWGSIEHVPEHLHWMTTEGSKTILFHLRCWITRHVVRLPRKGKGRVGGKAPVHSDGDHSEIDGACSPPRASSSHAPPAPRMIPGQTHARISSFTAINTDRQSSEVSLKEGLALTPKKRKFGALEPQSAPGKLQKVQKNNIGASTIRQNTYSIPDSPEPTSYAMRPAMNALLDTEGTCDPDGTYVPPRAATQESDTGIDPDEVLAETSDLIDEFLGISTAAKQLRQRSPTAGRSGMYQAPNRQDSVIPNDEQPALNFSEAILLDEGVATRERAMNYAKDIAIPTSRPDDVGGSRNSKLERQLRNELFTLLLSYLNGINDFTTDNFKRESEERMNSLIRQLWQLDMDHVEAKFTDTFARLSSSLNTWMDMRQQFEGFRVATGYFGAPGDDWKSHLKRMGHITRAKAVIAYVTLKSMQSATNAGWHLETFDSDLTTVFDELTQVDGCNGAEEFGSVPLYNRTLIDWFC